MAKSIQKKDTEEEKLFEEAMNALASLPPNQMEWAFNAALEKFQADVFKDFDEILRIERFGFYTVNRFERDNKVQRMEKLERNIKIKKDLIAKLQAISKWISYRHMNQSANEIVAAIKARHGEEQSSVDVEAKEVK